MRYNKAIEFKKFNFNKLLFIYFLLFINSTIYATNIEALKNSEIYFGFQKTQIINSDFSGNKNFSFGANKLVNFSKYGTFSYGFEYSEKGINQNNARIVSDSFTDHTGLTISNMDYTFEFISLKIALRINLIHKQNFSLYPMIGYCYELNLSHRSNSEFISYNYYDDPVTEYDYMNANEPYPHVLANSGYNGFYGIGIKYNRLFLRILYNKSNYTVNRIKYIMIDEQFYGVKTVLGYEF